MVLLALQLRRAEETIPVIAPPNVEALRARPHFAFGLVAAVGATNADLHLILSTALPRQTFGPILGGLVHSWDKLGTFITVISPTPAATDSS